MREKRGQLFNRSRFGLEINSRDVQGALTEIVRSELNNLASIDLDPELNPFSPITNQPLNPEEAFELETEILKEEGEPNGYSIAGCNAKEICNILLLFTEEWILQEYERMSQDEIDLLSTFADQGVDDVICPKCQKSNLIQKENKVACNTCEFTLNNCISLKQIGHLISRSVDIHSAYCKEPPGFLSVPENNIMSLYLICDKCSAWTHII